MAAEALTPWERNEKVAAPESAAKFREETSKKQRAEAALRGSISHLS